MSTHRVITIALLGAFAVTSRIAGAQAKQSGAAKADVETAIHKLEQSYIDARLHADTAALRKLLADDYVAVGSRGEVIDKASVLRAPDKNAAGDKFSAMEHGQVTVRVVGSTAVATGLRKVTTDKGANDTRFTHVYVEREGTWRLMSSQVTLVAK